MAEPTAMDMAEELHRKVIRLKQALSRVEQRGHEEDKLEALRLVPRMELLLARITTEVKL
jgi:hypothetical protein